MELNDVPAKAGTSGRKGVILLAETPDQVRGDE
jgi:hypothetical protein